MITAEESTSKMIENQFNFNFEYASWNLVFDEQDFITCLSKCLNFFFCIIMIFNL